MNEQSAAAATSGDISQQAPQVADTSSNATETTATTQSNNVGTNSSQQQQDVERRKDGGFYVVVDPVTGARELQVIKDNEGKTTDQEKSKEYVIPESGNTTPNAGDKPLIGHDYSEQEFAIALQLGSVDENRIPEQYKEQYRNVLAQQLQQQANVSQPQGQQSVPIKTDEQIKLEQESIRKQSVDFYDKIDNIAKQQAMSDIGIAEDELLTAEYTDDADLASRYKRYKTAVEWNRQKVMQGIQQQMLADQQARLQKQAIYADIDNRVNEYKAKEPNFDKINIYMESRYKTLPYAEAVQIAEVIDSYQKGTITPEQCKVLEKYYDDTRLDFYAKNNNLATIPTSVAKPASLETPGSGASVRKEFDFKALGKADNREKDRMLAEFFGFKK